MLTRRENLAWTGVTWCLMVLVFSVISTPVFAFRPADNAPELSDLFGQPDTTTSTASSDTKGGMDSPTDVQLTGDSTLFVADQGNHRVLFYEDLTDTVPDRFLGDPTGTSGTSDTALNTPSHVALWNGTDTSVLFVSDRSNNRVLAFIVSTIDHDTPFSEVDGGAGSLAPDTRADYVFGQGSFTTTATGSDSLSLSSPSGLSVNETGGNLRLYVADAANNRVVRFDNTVSAFGSSAIDTQIDRAWGSSIHSAGSGDTTNEGLNEPEGIHVHGGGDTLFIVDKKHHRVVTDAIGDGDTTFDNVWGQPDFTTDASASDTFGFTDPLGIVTIDTTLAIADGPTLDRVLFFSLPFDSNDTGADVVLGDVDFDGTTKTEINAPDTRSVDNPNGLSITGSSILVAEAGGSGNRVSVFGNTISSGSDDSSGCLIERSGLDSRWFPTLRSVRDRLMQTAPGRLLTDYYYRQTP